MITECTHLTHLHNQMDQNRIVMERNVQSCFSGGNQASLPGREKSKVHFLSSRLVQFEPDKTMHSHVMLGYRTYVQHERCALHHFIILEWMGMMDQGGR